MKTPIPLLLFSFFSFVLPSLSAAQQAAPQEPRHIDVPAVAPRA
jgi:hypothetical protein